MKTRIFLALAILALSVFVFMGCDTGSSTSESSPDPSELRFYNDTSSARYYAVGDYNSSTSTTTLLTNWVYIESGNTSLYTSFEAGSHNFCYDTDSDHDSFQAYTNPFTFEEGIKYTFTQTDSDASVAQDS